MLTVGAGIGLAVLALALATGAFAAPQTKAPKDCGLPRVEPTRIVLGCADFSAYVNRIHWGHWGNGRARGHGKFRLNDCDPSCAQGTFHTYPAKVVLHDPKRSRCHGRRPKMFQEMNMRFPHRKPPNARDFHSNELFCNP
jgi:hypothetical protein